MCFTNRSDRGFARLKLVLVSLLVLFALAASVWRASHFARSMAVVADSAKDIRQSKPDTKTKMVMEVTDAEANGTIRGKLLEKETEEQYTRTRTIVTTQSSAQTKMIMGKPEDVRKGAVIHLTGKLRDGGKLEVEQIVILTGYVKVD